MCILNNDSFKMREKWFIGLLGNYRDSFFSGYYVLLFYVREFLEDRVFLFILLWYLVIYYVNIFWFFVIIGFFR